MMTLPMRFLILAFFALDVTRGEITNEIKEYVQNILQEHTTEVKQLKKEISTLKEEMLSLQQSYQNVLKELNEKPKKNEPLVTKNKMDEEEEKQPIRLSPSKTATLLMATNTPGFRNHTKNKGLIRGERSTAAALRVNTIATYPTAFSASMSRSVSNIHHNQVLIFDNIIINSGNAYDTTSGIFTPTTKGVYAFFATITTNPGKSLEAEIIRNGVFFCSVYSGDSSMYSAGSNMAILPLNIGDHVMVRIHDHYHDTGVTIDGGFSSFSGYLLYETD